MTLKEQIDKEEDAIFILSDKLTERQLLASVLYELKKLRHAVKLVENELSIIKINTKRS